MPPAEDLSDDPALDRPAAVPAAAPEVSVVVCTHNPRPEYLDRTLAALRGQTLPRDRWELVVVDNASAPPVVVADARVRVVREPEPGLTRARIAGIREARAALLVLVDDDNVLASDYLEVALRIAAEHPLVGVFGGQAVPEFEVPPPAWLEPFQAQLAIAQFADDRWSNQHDPRVFPIGAGMCIRRPLAAAWAGEVAGDPVRRGLGRTGTNLISGEDTDMVVTCLRSGAGAGRFAALRLTHLIPRRRLEYGYTRRLAYATGFSAGRLSRHRDGTTRIRVLAQAVRSAAYLVLGTGSWRVRRIKAAADYGFLRGLAGLEP